MQTVPLTTTSPEAAALVGRWTGSWRSGAASSRFTLQIARGSGDRLTATAVWSGLPTVRREFTGTLANDQLILGDPKTEGLALTAQRRGVGGFSLGQVLGKDLDLVGPTRCSSTASPTRAPSTCRKTTSSGQAIPGGGRGLADGTAELSQ